MAVYIKGIRVDSVSIERNESGQEFVKEAKYSLISSIDKVLATQLVGGYQGRSLTLSLETIKALENFMALYKADVTNTLGLDLV
jgi:hypothetical protein